MLRFEHISHAYEASDNVNVILDNISLEITSGSFVMISGPSGSGKSTLLQLGSLLDKASSGRVFFNELDVSTLDDNSLSKLRASSIGLIFQSYHLLAGYTVLENVCFRFRYLSVECSTVIQLAQAALERVGIMHLSAKKAGLLSGGEMQRVAIARAIAVRPQILFADEPTGNLDSKSTEKVMATLNELNRQDMTILMATHDESLLCHATHWYAIERGKVLPRTLPDYV